MGARTGCEYIEALDERAIRVEIEGSATPGRLAIPQLRNVVQTYAQLFDLQHDPAQRDVMTYESPTPASASACRSCAARARGRRSGARGDARWAEYALGTLGRTGDYCNSALMALASAADCSPRPSAAMARTCRRYYEHVRENDLLSRTRSSTRRPTAASAPPSRRSPTLAPASSTGTTTAS